MKDEMGFSESIVMKLTKGDPGDGPGAIMRMIDGLGVKANARLALRDAKGSRLRDVGRQETGIL